MLKYLKDKLYLQTYRFFLKKFVRSFLTFYFCQILFFTDSMVTNGKQEI